MTDTPHLLLAIEQPSMIIGAKFGGPARVSGGQAKGRVDIRPAVKASGRGEPKMFEVV